MDWKIAIEYDDAGQLRINLQNCPESVSKQLERYARDNGLDFFTSGECKVIIMPCPSNICPPPNLVCRLPGEWS